MFNLNEEVGKWGPDKLLCIELNIDINNNSDFLMSVISTG